MADNPKKTRNEYEKFVIKNLTDKPGADSRLITEYYAQPDNEKFKGMGMINTTNGIDKGRNNIIDALRSVQEEHEKNPKKSAVSAPKFQQIRQEINTYRLQDPIARTSVAKLTSENVAWITSSTVDVGEKRPATDLSQSSVARLGLTQPSINPERQAAAIQAELTESIDTRPKKKL